MTPPFRVDNVEVKANKITLIGNKLNDDFFFLFGLGFSFKRILLDVTAPRQIEYGDSIKISSCILSPLFALILVGIKKKSPGCTFQVAKKKKC